jgi:hypothetical protein
LQASATDVPCNGCTLCCQGDAVRLQEDELGKGYRTEPHPRIAGALMIAHKPNGECIYLTEGGCRIHATAPALCRSADCRALAIRLDFEAARRLHLAGLLDIRVWDHGRELLGQMWVRKKDGQLGAAGKLRRR